MGRKTDVLLKGFRAAKCLTLLKVATARIKVTRNKRSMSAKQMRGEIAQLIKSGQDATVYITKADALIKQENMVAVYDLLDQYCHAVMNRFPAIEMQRNCPPDMKEAIASIIYAAPRCTELTELPAIKEAFIAKYGKEFGAAASELRPDCGVNTQIIELLSTRPATGDMKLKLMKEICTEHNVDWTPGDALARPAVASGRTEAKVEPLQATGTLGSIKANAGVGEAGPSKSAPPQGAWKHGASNKVGLAEATVTGKAGGEVLFATSAKTSDQKQSSSSQGDAAKGKSNVSEHLKGTLAEASSKTAAVVPDASKADSSSLSSFEEEDARRLHARILQSLKGGSFADLEGEAETPAEVSVKPVDAPDRMSDSDSDSFVSVEEGRFEDDLEPSLDKAASRKESFQEISNPGLAEADLHQPSLGKKLSDSSQKYTYSRAEADLQQPSLSKKLLDSSQKYTFSRAEADLQQPSLSKKLSDSFQKDSDIRASRENSGAAMEMHEGMPASSLASKSSHKDMFLRASSKKSSNAEQVMEKESRKDSFNMGKLVEGRFVEELKEDWMINEHEDIYARVSSKKSSSNAEEVMEKVSRKDSLNKGNLFETHSVVKLNEDMRMNEMVAEPLSVEKSDKEDLLRKDSLKGESAKATPESLFTLKLPKEHSFETTKIAEEPSDEGFLQGEGDGMIKVTPSVSTPGNDLEGERVADSSLEVQSIGEEKPKLPLFKDQSGPEGVFHQEMFSAAGEEPCLSNEESLQHVHKNAVSGEKSLPSFENGGVSSIYPAVGISVEELVGASSLSALASLENTQDFAAAAKAIAAEAARLAILDYAKRMAEFGSIPLDVSELSKLGVAFEQNKGRPQVNKISTSEGKGESVDSEELGYAGESKNHDTDLIREEERRKEGTTLNVDKFHVSDHMNVDETTANIQKLKPPVADDAIDGDLGGIRNASVTAEEKPGLQEMVTGLEDINPFSTSIDKDTAALSSNIDDEKVSWVGMAQPGQTSNVGNYGRDDDHLDIFFRRKTPWMSEERPIFDEDRYSFLKPKPSFTEEKMSYGASDKATSSFQEDLFSKALFDTVPEGKTTAFKESSDSFKSPVFDEGEGVSFKIPVFDEGPEPYDDTFSSDDGLDKSYFSAKVSDKRKPQFTPIIKSPASFDSESEPEPEPYFEKIANEDELKERTESPSQGQLKWQSKKPIASVECVVVGDGVSGKPMSRRSRRQPKIYDDSEYGGDGSSQLTGRSSLLQQKGNEPIKKDEDSGHEKKSWGSNPVRPYVSSSNALGQRSSDSPTSISSSRITASPTRPVGRQRPRTEDDYFPEENDLVVSSAGTSRVRKTTKSPTRMTKQQPMTHGYDDEDDSEGYKLSYNIPSIPSIYQQDMVDDDHIEELQGRYKPSSQTSHLNKGTSAGSRIAESWKQQRRQQEEPGMRSEYKQYREDVGESPRTRQTSSRPQQKMYIEEEPYLVSRYKPTFRDDEPLDYERSNNSRIPQLYKLEINEDEDNQQQAHLQEEPGIGSNYKQYREESPRTRPVPNRRQHKKDIEEEEPHLISRYKQPVIQDDEPLNYGSNNKSRPPKSYQLEVDGDNQRHHHLQQEEPGMGSKYKQYGEDRGERLRTRPMSNRRQEDIEDEESNLVSRYKQAVIQDDVPLNIGSGKSSRTPKVYQTRKHASEDDQDLRARYRLHTQMDDPASLGADRRRQHHQQEDNDLKLGYVQYEEVPVKRERTPSGLSASQKLSDFEEEPYLVSGYKGSKQLDNQVKSSPSRPLSNRQQEKKRIEEVEDFEEEPYLVSGYKVSKQLDNQRKNSPSRPLSSRQQEKKNNEEVESPPRNNTPIATDDDLLHSQEEEEEHTEGPQQKQQWPMLSDDYEVDSQSKRENSGSQRQERIQKDEQQDLSGHWRKQSKAGEEVRRGREKQHLPLSSNKNNKEESYSFAEPAKQRHKSTPLPEGQQEQVGQLSKSSLYPSYSRKQDEENLLKSGQQELEHPDGRISTRDERQRPQEEGVNEGQQKKEIKDAGVDEEKKNGQQDKLGTKSQLLSQQLPQSTSSPLEASISDPIVLATIPPPVKKPVTPSASTAGKLESSASAPAPFKPPEVKVQKPPQKPPNLDDLTANFEAFRRARKGE